MYTLEIMDLSEELTAGLLYDGYNCWFRELTITRCPLDLIKRAPYSHDLTFKDMASTEDFCSYLYTWEGTRLTFNNCPSPNDHVLEQLSAFVPHSPGSRLFAYRIWVRHIHNCSDFSFATLRRAVEERNACVVVRNNLNSALACVTITGRCPFLYPDDRAWLASFPPDDLN
jgi:hypothetical protein